jgi:predicted O-linked N-acetylglucosamine transferase (SPINDLY family)
MEVRHLYKETIWNLPCMLAFESLPAEVPHAALPALANGYVTFGVFNRISKISKQAAEVWGQILGRVPGSKLLIKDTALDDSLVRENLLTRLAGSGIVADRVELRGGSPRLEHLAAFNDIDICLDPYPQNGGASTWEALRMGVPVIAKIGNALPRRAAAGILTAVGLGDWVAETSEDYIAIAVKWATDIDELARLRGELPARLAASAAGNPETYAGEAAKAYRRMWQIYCAREADPASSLAQ